jgi:hypothetical protein
MKRIALFSPARHRQHEVREDNAPVLPRHDRCLSPPVTRMQRAVSKDKPIDLASHSSRQWYVQVPTSREARVAYCTWVTSVWKEQKKPAETWSGKSISADSSKGTPSADDAWSVARTRDGIAQSSAHRVKRTQYQPRSPRQPSGSSASETRMSCHEGGRGGVTGGRGVESRRAGKG